MKELIERQNDLRNQAEEILATAKNEKRAVTDEEKDTFDGLTKEIEAIGNTLEMEDKINKMEVNEIKQQLKLSIKNINYKTDVIPGQIEESRLGFLPLQQNLNDWINKKLEEYEYKE